MSNIPLLNFYEDKPSKAALMSLDMMTTAGYTIKEVQSYWHSLGYDTMWINTMTIILVSLIQERN